MLVFALVGSLFFLSQLLQLGYGMSPFDAGPLLDAASRERRVAYATGSPGDVYVVHPFTVHAADEHRGATPRFMAQGPVMLTSPLSPDSAAPLASVFG